MDISSTKEQCGWTCSYKGYRIPPLRCRLPKNHHQKLHDPMVPLTGKFNDEQGIPPQKEE